MFLFICRDAAAPASPRTIDAQFGRLQFHLIVPQLQGGRLGCQITDAAGLQQVVGNPTGSAMPCQFYISDLPLKSLPPDCLGWGKG